MRGPARTGDAFTRKTAIRAIARAFVQPVTYLGVAMLLFIYCALAYLLVADRKVAEYDAGLRGDNLARVVDQSFVHIFKSIDATLLFLRKSYQQSPSTLDLAAWVHDPSLKNELTFDFIICEANGRIVESSFQNPLLVPTAARKSLFAFTSIQPLMNFSSANLLS